MIKRKNSHEGVCDTFLGSSNGTSRIILLINKGYDLGAMYKCSYIIMLGGAYLSKTESHI